MIARRAFAPGLMMGVMSCAPAPVYAARSGPACGPVYVCPMVVGFDDPTRVVVGNAMREWTAFTDGAVQWSCWDPGAWGFTIEPGALPDWIRGETLADRSSVIVSRAALWDLVTVRKIVLHELGHVLGLGHVSGPEHVMSPSVPVGLAQLGAPERAEFDRVYHCQL